jgi:pyrroloquinoline quinone biosynthesis protein B
LHAIKSRQGWLGRISKAGGTLRIIVLGSAAGGGAPQWNCHCPVCAEAWRTLSNSRFRSQAGLAVSIDGQSWLLLNASPDLRQQILVTPALQPRGPARRSSPIVGVFLTSGDVDAIAGLLCLRERQALDLYATKATLAILADNSIFQVLDKALVQRHSIELETDVVTAAGLVVRAFAVPGKVPLYLEGDDPDIGVESDSVIGLSVSEGPRRFFFIPGCANITPALRQRLAGAALVFFDGTTFTDDEMPSLGLSEKSAGRMGHIAMSGPRGSLSAFAQSAINRKVYIHINNTNPVLREGSPEYRALAEADWELAYDGMEIEL